MVLGNHPKIIDDRYIQNSHDEGWEDEEEHFVGHLPENAPQSSGRDQSWEDFFWGDLNQ